MNELVQSERSKRLTSDALICAPCNNALTRPYDLAWDALSGHMQANWPLIRRRGYIDLSAVFPGRTRKEALNVHLYFVKLFGCRIVEHGLTIDIGPFARALIAGTAHPDMRLNPCDASRLPLRRVKSIYVSEIQTQESSGGQPVSAVWSYNIGDVTIHVSYLKRGARLRVVGGGWHPDEPTKRVKLGRPVDD